MARLQEHYREVVRPAAAGGVQLQEPDAGAAAREDRHQHGGRRRRSQDAKKLTNAQAELTKISGQKPAVCRARKSVANFKLREGMPIGCKVTLRRERMYEFLDRLVNIALPRVRDFRGVSPKSFDGRGNYALGVTEQIIFPEINFDEVEEIRGMDIIICTTAQTDEEAKALLAGFDMPFRK